MSLLTLIGERVREQGAVTVAEFMELALYHPEYGYYTSAAQRSGRSGDFFTSVDASARFGGTVAEQLAEMWDLLRARGERRFDLVEAGAGNGRLSRDILDAVLERHPGFYHRIRLTLVERSAAARAAQREALGPHFHLLASSADALPAGVHGVILANELLDALPVHVVQMTADGLQEVMVAERDGALIEELTPVGGQTGVRPGSDQGQTGVRPGSDRGQTGVRPGSDRGQTLVPALDPGQRAEVGLAALDWIRDAASSLARGFLLLFDYGYTPSENFFRAHPEGTLMSYRAHRASGDGWLRDPGGRDITSHVNLTAVRTAAEASGLSTIGIVDQTYFLVGLGLADRLPAGDDQHAIRQRLAARTLLMPGGLGDTMKVMAFAKGLGTPALRGFRAGRLT